MTINQKWACTREYSLTAVGQWLYYQKPLFNFFYSQKDEGYFVVDLVLGQVPCHGVLGLMVRLTSPKFLFKHSVRSFTKLEIIFLMCENWTLLNICSSPGDYVCHNLLCSNVSNAYTSWVCAMVRGRRLGIVWYLGADSLGCMFHYSDLTVLLFF